MKEHSSQQDESARTNSEIRNLKDALDTSSNKIMVSRNDNSKIALALPFNTTTSTSFAGKPVPKLDFKRLKKVQEFKDWYAYASKLEDSVKFLRIRIKQLEDDNTELNKKFRKE